MNKILSLKEYREKENLTQKHLAFISEISYLDLVKYEEGFQDLPQDRAMIFASILHCDYRELMGVEKDGK